MFTGIVEDMGTVVRLMRRGGGARLEVRAPGPTPSLKIGDSIAVNGACVTVTESNGEVFACDLVPETVARTNLGILHIGEGVNIEMPMQAGGRFGGHIVQGHIDCVGTVRSRRRAGAQEMLEVNVPFELTKYIATQGSVAIDGVSLTVVAVDKDRFRVALIPHTVSVTTLGQKGQGASVNVEVDVLSKYVERHLQARQLRSPFQIKPQEEAMAERAAADLAAAQAANQPKPAAKPAKPAVKVSVKPHAAKPPPKTSRPARAKTATKKAAAKRPARKAKKASTSRAAKTSRARATSKRRR